MGHLGVASLEDSVLECKTMQTPTQESHPLVFLPHCSLFGCVGTWGGETLIQALASWGFCQQEPQSQFLQLLDGVWLPGKGCLWNSVFVLFFKFLFWSRKGSRQNPPVNICIVSPCFSFSFPMNKNKNKNHHTCFWEQVSVTKHADLLRDYSRNCWFEDGRVEEFFYNSCCTFKTVGAKSPYDPPNLSCPGRVTEAI